MFIKEAVIAFLIAVVLTGLFTLVSPHMRGARKVGDGTLWFFLIVFTAAWAGGIWLQPIGPPLADIYWLPYMVAGLMIAFLAAFLKIRRPPQGRHETLDKLEEVARAKNMQAVTYITLRALFWIVLSLFCVAIIVRYVLR